MKKEDETKISEEVIDIKNNELKIEKQKKKRKFKEVQMEDKLDHQKNDKNFNEESGLESPYSTKFNLNSDNSESKKMKKNSDYKIKNNFLTGSFNQSTFPFEAEIFTQKNNIESKENVFLYKNENSKSKKGCPKNSLENNLIQNFSNSEERPKIKTIYYINANKMKVCDLKDGRRIFNNKTELNGYQGFRENFIEFRQLFFENLLLNEDFRENLKEEWKLESAIFSTFCYEEDFILPLIKRYNLKTLLIKHCEENTHKTVYIEKNENITIIHPKIDFTLKYGKYHSKLTILKFPDFLRVVIPSANLTNGDWYYWGQIIWFQDFPLKNKSQNNSSTSDFEGYLIKMFELQMPTNFKNQIWFKNLNINLSEYDFSHTIVDLVASSSGRFSDTHEFGLGRLKYLKEKYSVKRKNIKNNKLIVQSSSIGKRLSDKFLKDLCEGFGCISNEENKLEIIFPTEEYIESFELGKDLSGCLFLSRDTYLLHRYKFKKLEVLDPKFQTVFHSKFIVALEEKSQNILKSNNFFNKKSENNSTSKHIIQENNFTINDNKIKSIPQIEIDDNSIFYFGSHNISIAAWGTLEKKDTQISMANYELGIIFNPLLLTYEEKQKISNSLLVNLNSEFYSNSDSPWINELF
jgi:tyrosyl-DNA phosphodiesterase-1